jgi:hypothetical protein
MGFSAATLHAQGYGTISGTVADPSGALISSATVTATQTLSGTVMTAVTGKDGRYVFPTLLPAPYEVSVSAAGFELYKQTGIVLQADQALTVNIKLKIGASSLTVSVSADAPQVDTTTGTLSQVIDEDRVVDLPLNGRNAAGLITLVAGVTDSTNEGNGVNQGNGKTFPAAVVTSSNGTLPNQENFLLDGGNNLDEMTSVNDPFPFPDALEEFSVQTSNYNAEYGQSAGAMVNVVTKSGTERFHGDGFEFLRNGFFNAQNHFLAPGGAPDTLHRHQFGGVIGGPVIIPHLSRGKSTQFFFGYQHTLLHNTSSNPSVTVPTLAEEGLTSSGALAPYADYSPLCAGNVTVADPSPAKTSSTYTQGFKTQGSQANVCTYTSVVSGTGPLNGQTDYFGAITNPFTNAIYSNNHIPSSDFDPASVDFEQAFPTAATDSGVGKIGNVVSYTSSTQNTYNEYLGRLDQNLGPKDHLFGHYYYNYFIQPAIYSPTNLASYSSYFNTRYQNALLAETHTFSSNILNNLVANYQREIALRGGPPGSFDITHYGVTSNLWQPPTGPYLSVTVTGYFKASSSAFAGWARNNYTFNDDLHWVKGAHNFAFGGHVELSKFDVTNVFQGYGGFTFGADSQTLNGVSIQYPNAAANYLLGFVSGGFSQGNYELLNDRAHFPSIYAQDSWKATHRLTLDYGVRWEQFDPWVNRVGAQTAFNPAAYAANTGTSQYNLATTSGSTGLPAGMVLSGDAGYPKNGINTKNAQFMPRLGFAYDVFGDGKTVVRGGAGIFYQDRLMGFFNLNQAGNVPNTISVALTNPGMLTASGNSPGGPFSNPYCQGGCSGKGTPYTNPFPFTLPFASTQVFPNNFSVDEFPPSGNLDVPVTYDYNLTIERELVAGWAVRVAGVSSASRHLFVNLELNPEVNNGSGLSTAQRRVYNTAPTIGPCASKTGCNTNYADIIEAAMVGAAHFNSLQLTLNKKMSHGLSLLANYTWSKSYDDLPQATRVSNTEDLNAGESYVYPYYPSSTVATGIPAASYVSDIKALDRGLSDIDKPQALSISYVYALPRLANANFIVRAVVNDWRTSGLVQHHSGDALTVYTATDNSLTGLSQDRGQRNFSLPAYMKTKSPAGDCPAVTATSKPCENWFNPAAFTVPTNSGPGTGFGNVVKDSLRGPGYTDWDGAVMRDFPVVRETHLEFRAEYFNVINHPNLSNPTVSGPTSSSTSFGTIGGEAGNPRQAQFSMKYIF